MNMGSTKGIKSKWNRSRDILVTLLIALATITQFVHGHYQDKVSNAKDDLLRSSIDFATSIAGVAANSSNILLQRDLLETCKSSSPDICGTTEFLLRGDVQVRPGVMANAYEAPDKLEVANDLYKATKSKYQAHIKVTNVFFHLFMVFAITFLLYRKKEL